MHRIAIGTESNTSASEAVHVLEGGIIARFPRIPDLKRRLPLIDVTRAVNSVTPVNLMTTVATVSADQTIQAGFNRGDGILGFNEYPHLEHVSGFSIVAGGFETGRDDDSFGVLVKDKAVTHRTPPTMNSATMRANTEIMNAASARNARADSRDFRDFIGIYRPVIGAHAK